MTAEVEADEPIPAWLPYAVLHAIREVAGRGDPARAGSHAETDVERVRRVIDRGDGILAAHRCSGDDGAIDVALARAALLIARVVIRPRPAGEADG